MMAFLNLFSKSFLFHFSHLFTCKNLKDSGLEILLLLNNFRFYHTFCDAVNNCKWRLKDFTEQVSREIFNMNSDICFLISKMDVAIFPFNSRSSALKNRPLNIPIYAGTPTIFTHFCQNSHIQKLHDERWIRWYLPANLKSFYTGDLLEAGNKYKSPEFIAEFGFQITWSTFWILANISAHYPWRYLKFSGIYDWKMPRIYPRRLSSSNSAEGSINSYS